MENGKRSDLPVKGAGSGYGVKADVPDQGWGELRVTARGPLFEVYLGERKLFEVEDRTRSEEHTSELQSLMRISYAVFCLKKKNKNTNNKHSSTRRTTTEHKYI